jgi:predicted MFS family arabinose efflux permease
MSVQFVFKSKLYNRVTLLIYTVIFFISLMAYGIGYVSGNYSQGYSIARQLMGWLQSPIVLMILMPALFLNKNDKEKK